MTHPVTATRVKLKLSREALIQRTYYALLLSASICWKYSSSMSTICADNIRANFSISRRCCMHSSAPGNRRRSWSSCNTVAKP